MTRKQLFNLRKKYLRKRRNNSIILAALLLAAAVGLFVFLLLLDSGSKGDDSPETALPRVDAPGDSAVRMMLPDSVSGEYGWNVTDEGWWYLNEDDTQFVSGWKTIDGQRYYFNDDGFLATGWTDTGDEGASFFDICGILVPEAVRKYCAVTFDGGPSGKSVSIINALLQINAKGTFFAGESQAEHDSLVLTRESLYGFEIGNDLGDEADLSYENTTEKIQKNDEAISSALDSRPSIARLPENLLTEELAEASGKAVIMWDVDLADWASKSWDETMEELTETIRDGSIIRVHELYGTAEAAAWYLLPRLQQMGFKLVTVSELAEIHGYAPEPGKIYYHFYPEEPAA
ncbi:MAG: polysaccharide deacetylase family protein [Lachnospiraceae bacterium]|nr:polysaccharide deacetylase family protein [Lachnospiraceae bacterium]